MAECKYFVTTDDRLLKYQSEKIILVTPGEFIALIKRNDFDYTIWQREYFDKLAPGEFAANASAYAQSHPYTGKGQIL